MTFCENSATEEYLSQLWATFGNLVECIDADAEKKDRIRFISAEDQKKASAMRRQLSDIAAEIRTIERGGQIPHKRCPRRR